MAKFCKNCGTKLDENTGLCPRCDGGSGITGPNNRTHSEQTLTKKELKKKKKADKKNAKKLKKKEKKEKKKSIRAQWSLGKKIRRFCLKLFFLMICLFVLGTGIVGTLAYFHIVDIPAVSKLLSNMGIMDEAEEFDLTSDFECLNGSYTTRKIVDEASALAAIEDAKEVLGIENVSEELMITQTNEVADNTYYRFDQKYNGIPVYGRSISISADPNGKCLMLTGNYANLGKIKTDIKCKEDDVIKELHNHFGEETSIQNLGLRIYSLENEPELAWMMCIENENINEYCFVSTESGQIMKELSFVYEESVTGNGEDIDEINREFLTEKTGKKYTLSDSKRGISIYDACDSTLKKEIIIVDSDGNHYKTKDNSVFDSSGKEVFIEGENFYYVIKDGDGNIIGTDGQIAVEMKTANIFTKVKPVTSKKTTWKNKKAVTVMNRLSKIFDFWESTFERHGYNGKYGQTVVVLNDYRDGDSGNAESWGNNYITVLSFGTDSSLGYDVIGHEYMHSIERSISNMNYEGESGALMEAYSDIFGEIVEDYDDDGELNNSCDWIYNPISRKRRIINDPQSSNNPFVYQGENWIDTADIGDRGGVHTNSTVISYAAFLMSNGINGDSSYEALRIDQIAELFYTNLFHMTSNCTFNQFKTILINNAGIMKLSSKQRMCVEEAFNRVGLDSSKLDYTGFVSTSFDLSVFDVNGEMYDSYSVLLEKADSFSKLKAKINLGKLKISEVEIREKTPYHISLKPGRYKITIRDLADTKKVKSFYIVTGSSGEKELTVFTLFGRGDKEDISQTILSEPYIPSDAVEFNGHYYYLYNNGVASTYEEALQYCQDRGGYLATLTTKEENDFVYSYMMQQNCQGAYFGLSDAANEGNWEWCTGEVLSYQNWHSGEPNGENSEEDYGSFYYKYEDGTWNDGDFGNQTANDSKAFLCEWGDYTSQSPSPIGEEKQTSHERDVVLVLDRSQSMSGRPLAETKKASFDFIDTVLKEDASIGVVTYDSWAECVCEITGNQSVLQAAVSEISDGGSTNIESGLYEAQRMLSASSARKKIIVLMSDGQPNEGKIDEELIAYADEIKQQGTLIYTIGFFESLDEKSEAQWLMERIASDGCHYEVASADELVFFFNDMADQINGQKYIYVRIACPVDVSVTYNGQMLNSSDDNSNFRADFGTLTFEENETDSFEETPEGQDNRIKVLRLKEGIDYDLKLTGTGRGIMNYTIGFMDEDGNYSDLRKFENIRITQRTKIDTVAAVSPESILNIDEDGDGKYDLKLRAEENGYGEEVKIPEWIIYAMIGAGTLILVDILLLIILRIGKKKKRKVR